jgi:hypothetical protein
VIRVKANLRRPIEVNGHRLLPFGWQPHTEGWMQIDLTIGGTLGAAALLVIVAAA